MTDDEKRKEEFEALPFELQMEILQERKRSKDMTKHMDEVIDLLDRMTKDFNRLESCSSVNEAIKTCFLEAEFFDSIKPMNEDDDFAKEVAKEFDFFRHLVSTSRKKPLLTLQYAVKAVRKAMGGNFDEANLLASIPRFEDEDEYKSIIEYWKKTAEGNI